MIFDLHTHTYFSDGNFSPEQLIDLAISKRIDGIAITDHDTIEALNSAIEYSKKLNKTIVIPGIEFGCVFEYEDVHILGYFIDYNSKEIINTTKKLKINRKQRAIKMIKKINFLGMELTLEDINEFSKNNYIGRPHIAKALIQKGYFTNVNEVFDKLLDRGKPAYVEKESLTLIETINLIHKNNGLAILAHPGLLNDKHIISYCINNGIDGLEAIHSKHTRENVKMFLEIARHNELIVTGGSDCHGKKINGEYLLGKYYININDIPQMKGRLYE